MPAIKKRQQIASSNKVVFLSVAATSVVVGVSAVLLVFLVQKLVFNERVLSEKATTVSTLKQNIEASDELKRNIRVLNTNQRLLDARASDEDSALQVILDALPSQANSSALGASLEKVLLIEEGVNVQSIDVTATDDEQISQEGESAASNDEVAGENAIAFNFTVEAGSVDQLKALLNRLERSIRAIDVQSLSIEVQESGVTMNVSAVAYYESEIKVDLKDKVVRP